MKYLFCIAIAAFLATDATLVAQGERKDKTPVTYEELYDEPASINKLFVGLTPLYGELFVTNVNVGFGLDAKYYLKDKADFHGQFRKTYSSQFFDQARRHGIVHDVPHPIQQVDVITNDVIVASVLPEFPAVICASMVIPRVLFRELHERPEVDELALAMHALGVLCGGAASPERDGYLFIAFKPDLFMPLDDYRRALAAEITAIRATPRQAGVGEIRIPGERALRDRARLSREGLEIDRRIHDALLALAAGK